MQLFLLFVGCVPVLTSPPGTADDGVWEAPENTWPQNTPPAGLEGEGVADGEIAPDFLLKDQYGDDVSLWQFYGSVIILDVSTMWCAPCRVLASEAQAVADDYRDEGFVYITLLSQDLGSDVPDQDELNDWGDYYHLTEPILADPAGYSDRVVPPETGAFPGVLIFGRDMKVIERIEPANDDTIRAAIEAAL
jgi:thiol-disulfide isomerase/thioredoxin